MEIIMVWYILGILTGVSGMLLVNAIKNGKIKLKVWQYICIGAWYLLMLLTAGFVNTSIGEGEPRAAGMALLIFGGILLVLAVVLYRFVIYKAIAKKDMQKV